MAKRRSSDILTQARASFTVSEVPKRRISFIRIATVTALLALAVVQTPGVAQTRNTGHVDTGHYIGTGGFSATTMDESRYLVDGISTTSTTSNGGIVYSDGQIMYSTSSGQYYCFDHNHQAYLCTASGQEIRKDDGKGPTLIQVKQSSHLIHEASLAPAAYVTLAKQIGLDPSAATDEADVLEGIHHNEMHVYDFDQVDNYLYRQALRQKSPSRWVWSPLRAKDAKAAEHSAGDNGGTVGYISDTQYRREVPLRVMGDIKALLDCIGDKAMFLVSDYKVLSPDPFLAVTTPRLLEAGKIWIVDCWDEPGFTEKGQEAHATLALK